MAEDEIIGADPLWSVKLESVRRVVNDEAEGSLFEVEFEVRWLDVNGSLEVLVLDVDDEARIVLEALSTLQSALETWARVAARRRAASVVEPKSE